MIEEVDMMNDEHLCLLGRNLWRSVTHPATTYKSLYQSISLISSLQSYRLINISQSTVSCMKPSHEHAQVSGFEDEEGLDRFSLSPVVCSCTGMVDGRFLPQYLCHYPNMVAKANSRTRKVCQISGIRWPMPLILRRRQ